MALAPGTPYGTYASFGSLGAGGMGEVYRARSWACRRAGVFQPIMTDRSQPWSLSHYRVISKLGAGGMGEVYLAEDTRLNRKVAIKLLPAELTRNADSVRRFMQEAKAASALNHPNIITVHDIGESDDGRFIVMELVSGTTLRSVPGTHHEVSTLVALVRPDGQGADRRPCGRDYASRSEAGQHHGARRRLRQSAGLRPGATGAWPCAMTPSRP